MEESRSIADSAHRQADNAYNRAREVHNLIQPKEHGQRYRNRFDEIDRRLDELEHRPGLKAV